MPKEIDPRMLQILGIKISDEFSLKPEFNNDNTTEAQMMLMALGKMSVGGNGSGTRKDDEATGIKNRPAALTPEGGK